ncbi:hypothetical protein KCP74_15100 [Salmonella enterica subsp. enterica]|nr:hypothetical protein KCP74_15100 [Salmonella enterica subsp. enterica]
MDYESYVRSILSSTRGASRRPPFVLHPLAQYMRDAFRAQRTIILPSWLLRLCWDYWLCRLSSPLCVAHYSSTAVFAIVYQTRMRPPPYQMRQRLVLA